MEEALAVGKGVVVASTDGHCGAVKTISAKHGIVVLNTGAQVRMNTLRAPTVEEMRAYGEKEAAIARLKKGQGIEHRARETDAWRAGVVNKALKGRGRVTVKWYATGEESTVPKTDVFTGRLRIDEDPRRHDGNAEWWFLNKAFHIFTAGGLGGGLKHGEMRKFVVGAHNPKSALVTAVRYAQDKWGEDPLPALYPPSKPNTRVKEARALAARGAFLMSSSPAAVPEAAMLPVVKGPGKGAKRQRVDGDGALEAPEAKRAKTA
jgi:hypothetical protein